MSSLEGFLNVLKGICRNPRLWSDSVIYLLLDFTSLLILVATVHPLAWWSLLPLLVFLVNPLLWMFLTKLSLSATHALHGIAKSGIILLALAFVAGWPLGPVLLAVLLCADAARTLAFTTTVYGFSNHAYSKVIVCELAATFRVIALVAIFPIIYAPPPSLRAVGLLALLGLLFVLTAGLATDQLIEYLWVRWRMRKAGLIVGTFYWKTSVAGYLEDKSFAISDGLIYQAALSLQCDRKVIYGFSIGFGHRLGSAVSRLEALNIAACELYERFVTLASEVPNRNVNSNGVALQLTLEEAKRRSSLELLERDSVMAHYYTSKPAFLRFNLKDLSETSEVPSSLQVVGAIARAMESVWAFKLYSPVPDTNIYWVVIRHDGGVTSGWSTGSDGNGMALAKAFAEAISVFRFRNLKRNEELLRRLLHLGLSSVTRENFSEVCAGLGVTNTDLQCLLLLGSDPHGTNIMFLQQCPVATSLPHFLTVNRSEFWYSPPEVQFDILPQTFESPFYIVRARSDSVFQIDWPKVMLSEILFTASKKGIERQLGPNIEAPCIVY